MPVLTTSSLLTHLDCSRCGSPHSPLGRQTLSACCQAPLLCRYALNERTVSRADLVTRPHSLWRYEEWLPVVEAQNRISLGEGWTLSYRLTDWQNSMDCTS